MKVEYNTEENAWVWLVAGEITSINGVRRFDSRGDIITALESIGIEQDELEKELI